MSYLLEGSGKVLWIFKASKSVLIYGLKKQQFKYFCQKKVLKHLKVLRSCNNIEMECDRSFPLLNFCTFLSETDTNVLYQETI